MKLRISSTLSLPLDAMMKKHVFIGQSGTGKTNAGVVLVEELDKTGGQFVVIDGMGGWWGLRTSRDGTSEGIDVFILGGEHGDMPLEPSAGGLVADFIVKSGHSFILDLSLMRKGQSTLFMLQFCERLFEAKATNKTPLHLMIDEADQYAPQETREGGNLPRLVGAVEDLVRRGRQRGIATSMNTQRPAVLNKSCISQADVLHVFRLVSPQDTKALDDWVRARATPEQKELFTRDLPRLPVGDCFVWSPAWLDIFKRIHVRERETFDSSATPEVGVKAPKITARAKVDIDGLKAEIAASIEVAKAEDPTLLRARIQELESKLSAKPAEVTSTKEVSVLGKETAAELHALIDDFSPLVEDMRGLVEVVRSSLARVEVHGAVPAGERTARSPAVSPAPPVARAEKGVAPPPRQLEAPASELPKCERAVLSVLATHGTRSKEQLALQTGYTVGSLKNALAGLRASKFISGGGEAMSITDAGSKALGAIEQLPQGRALLEYWLANVDKCERAIIGAAVDAYPGSLTKEDLAASTKYTVGSLKNALARLRSLVIIVDRGDIALTQTFGEAIS